MDVIKLINKALIDEDIGTVLGANDKIMKYSELKHIDDLDDLLTKKIDFCIILYKDRPDRGHWAALSKYNGIYEHFDSYGNKARQVARVGQYENEEKAERDDAILD